MMEPAFLEAILFFVFCLITIAVYKLNWSLSWFYLPIVGIVWLLAGGILTNLIVGWYHYRHSCIYCPECLMPNYGWFQVWSSLNFFVPVIVIFLSIWVDERR